MSSVQILLSIYTQMWHLESVLFMEVLHVLNSVVSYIIISPDRVVSLYMYGYVHSTLTLLEREER